MKKRFINVRIAMDVCIRANASNETIIKRLWKKGQKHFRLPKHS